MSIYITIALFFKLLGGASFTRTTSFGFSNMPNDLLGMADVVLYGTAEMIKNVFTANNCTEVSAELDINGFADSPLPVDLDIEEGSSFEEIYDELFAEMHQPIIYYLVCDGVLEK